MNLSNLNLDSLNLSDRAEELLEYVLESEQEGHYDDRGYYCEFDNFHCKPWNPNEISELLALGYVTLHPDSDTVPMDINPKESYGGVAFLKLNKPKFLSLNLKEF